MLAHMDQNRSHGHTLKMCFTLHTFKKAMLAFSLRSVTFNVAWWGESNSVSRAQTLDASRIFGFGIFV